MSDGNLITGARAVYANRGYGSKFDSSAAFAAGLESGLEPIKLRQAEEKKFKQAVEKKVTAWGAKLDDTIDSKNIPTAYREEINGFLVGLKDEYWHHAQVASKAEPGSDAYREAVSGMNAVNSSMKNHKAQLTQYTERAYALKTANEKKQLSSGNKASDMAINSDVYGQEMPLQISEDGGLNFMNEDGSSITMDQLPEYALTDHDANLEYIKMSKTVLNSGHKLTGKLGGMQRDMINTMLRKGSRSRWLHFATDSGIADGGLGIVNPHDLSDEDLLQQVSTGLFNALSEVADEGYARKNPPNKTVPPPTKAPAATEENTAGTGSFNMEESLVNIDESIFINEQDEGLVALEELFKDSGFKFKKTGILWGDSIKITAPNGASESFKFDLGKLADRKRLAAELKKWMSLNQAGSAAPGSTDYADPTK